MATSRAQRIAGAGSAGALAAGRDDVTQPGLRGWRTVAAWRSRDAAYRRPRQRRSGRGRWLWLGARWVGDARLAQRVRAGTVEPVPSPRHINGPRNAAD